jgi:multidrug efflux pump subunit AcrA (membrane-fusion protein)
MLPHRRWARVNPYLLGVVAVVAIAAGAVLAIPSLRNSVGIHWGPEAGAAESQDKGPSATIIRTKDGTPGLRFTKEAIDGLQIDPVPAKKPASQRPLPAQGGTVNYDIDRIFSLPARVPGEIAEMAEVEEPGISDKPVKRPLRAYDRVKQGQLLCVVYSPTIGQQKAALVDALCSLSLSQDSFERHKVLYEKGSLSFAQLKADERQMQADQNSVYTAERTLRLWKINDQEIEDIKKQARDILEKKVERNPEAEAKQWGRVEVRVPVFDADHMDRELTIVEKNTNLGAMVDPINTSTPLFRVTDMCRLQLWAHPPEEYLPLIRKMLDDPSKGPARWDVRFQNDGDRPPMELTFFQIASSLDPAQHSPMVIGYLDNPKGNKYVVGQFVTVTLYVAPEADTVEVRTDSLNEVNGESIVFVQSKTSPYEFIQRRVVVVARFKDWSLVRTRQLTPAEELQSRQEVARGRPPLVPIQEGDRLVTRGILESTACLEYLLSQEAAKK